MLENLARRIRPDGSVPSKGMTLVAPDASLLIGDEPGIGALDLFLDRDAVTVTVETHNVESHEVHVSIADGRLILALGENAGGARREIALPAPVNEERAYATFRNGILDIVLPRRA